MDVLSVETKNLSEERLEAMKKPACLASVVALAHIVAEFETMLLTGTSKLVTVVGTAGMGKTSLLCAFAEVGRRLGWEVQAGGVKELATLEGVTPRLTMVDNIVRADEENLLQTLKEQGENLDMRPQVTVLAVRSSELSQMSNLRQFCESRGQVISLNSLSRSQVEVQLRDALAETECCQEQLNRLVHETAGHPLMTGLMLEQLHTCSELTEHHVSSIVETAHCAMSKLVWKPLLDGLSDGDLAFLEAMAQDDEPTRMRQISTRLGKSPQYTGVYRNRLVAAEIIRSASYGKVTFVTPLLRHYVRQLIAQRMENQF